MKENPKRTKAQKRETRYGNPVLKKLVDEQPSIEYLYDRYKDCGRNQLFDMFSMAIFMLFGMIWLGLSAFGQGCGTGGLIFMATSFYWLSESQRDSDKRYFYMVRIFDEWEKNHWRELLQKALDKADKGKRKTSKTKGK